MEVCRIEGASPDVGRFYTGPSGGTRTAVCQFVFKQPRHGEVWDREFSAAFWGVREAAEVKKPIEKLLSVEARRSQRHGVRLGDKVNGRLRGSLLQDVIGVGGIGMP